MTYDTDTPPGGFGVAASAMATLGGKMAQRYGADCDRPAKRLFEQMHQIPIGLVNIPITAGAGAYQMMDLLGVRAGFMMSIRRLTASGYTAGSVQVFKNGFTVGTVATGGELVAPFAAAGTSTFGRGEILLDQGDQLVISCTGITGTVQLQGSADLFERWLLSEYLM